MHFCFLTCISYGIFPNNRRSPEDHILLTTAPAPDGVWISLFLSWEYLLSKIIFISEMGHAESPNDLFWGQTLVLPILCFVGIPDYRTDSRLLGVESIRWNTADPFFHSENVFCLCRVCPPPPPIQWEIIGFLHKIPAYFWNKQKILYRPEGFANQCAMCNIKAFASFYSWKTWRLTELCHNYRAWTIFFSFSLF